ncbi:MAG TPA: apolipoprotein N-acyltransferase [Sulfuricurvum sp.]|nr:MAG: apolipoprotein N-acyltransferase [Campylobacterales bacterium 16-40-21]OZA02979.1 MAG: apolipoprotein N-acyltransferase [Sulfuricurvum sp. 17-40-25]HQS66938.1 apolipoprotein N-acyltransferase [Sulfuricurvum sp.]HQT35676.1 apolipoprotein N-acyltransferase [Sulfuricurvum sp.]
MKLQSKTTFELLTLPLLIAISFSAFIYFEHFHLTLKALNTIAGLLALYGLLHAPKRTLPIAGFWIGLLWCYWIGYSFQYYGLGWAKIWVALGFGVVYALYYGSMGLTNNPWLRALILFVLTYFWPMDFNWMQPELIFVESYIGYEKWQFAVVLLSLASTSYFVKYKKIIPLLALIIAIPFPYTPPKIPDLRIKLVSTDISQDLKWQESMMSDILNENLRQIDLAIAQGYDLVVLPESAFVLYMNHYPFLEEQLQLRSQSIAILTGTLHEENQLHYNVSYLFNKGEITVAKKTILVPFGEYIPLPKILQDWVNRHVFEGGSNFVTADKPTDFIIKGVKFRNAICYEATREELYTPDAKYMIAISNNGWFKPSIEPTLQNLLIRFYARKNGTMVFHAANGGGTGIVY